MRRLASIILVLALLLLSAPPTVEAAPWAERLTLGDYEYTLNEDGSATITKYTGSDAELIIPGEIDGRPVTEIGRNAFNNNETVTDLTIPDSVIAIRSSAFCHGKKLKRVSIGAGVTEMESNPFYGCLALRDVEVAPGNPVYVVIDGVLFYEPEMRLVVYPARLSFAKCTVPEGTRIIGSNAFMSHETMTSVYIPEGVEEIENGAFSYCDYLKSVTIPDSVVSIGNNAFFDCSALERVELSANVRELGADNPFGKCVSLSEIAVSPGNPEFVAVDGVLFDAAETRLIAYPNGRAAERYEVPEGTAAIGNGAFFGAVNLKEILLPDGLKSIGNEAFYLMQRLAEVSIPEGVTEIGHSAFYYCDGLTRAVIPGSARTLGGSIFMRCFALTDVTLGSGLTEIPSTMFRDCTALIEINIPESVGKIDFGAFEGCTALETVTLSEGLTFIEDRAFAGCTALETLTLPEGVSEIRQGAFTGSDKLTLTVYEGSYAAGYAERAGIPCEYLTSTAPTPAPTPTTPPRPLGYRNYEYTLNEDGSATIIKYTDGYERELTIPEELDGHPVTAIGEKAFGGGHSIITLTIPDGIREIGAGAFGFSQILERVIIGAGVTEIGDNPFRDSKSLKYIEVAPGNPVLSVVNGALIYEPEGRLITYPAGLTDTSFEIPEGVESIGERAFIYCTGLTEIILPGSVRSIGSEAFSRCFGLERVVLGGGVRELGTTPFLWCTALKDIEIAPGNEVLEVRDGSLIYLPDMRLIAYSGGLPAEEYEVPEGVKTIGEYAFSDCPSLVSVTLPEGVTEVGEGAFGYCPALTSVTLPEGITEIPMQSFTLCTALTDLTIPESVSAIGWGAFNACDNLTLKVYEGSYGAEYAEYYKIPYEYAD